MTRLAANRSVARHGELVSGAGTSGRLSFEMAASRGTGSRSPLEGSMEKPSSVEVTITENPGTEALRQRVKPQGSSICAYCGARMPAARLDTTPPADDNRWTPAAPYHTPLAHP